MKTKKKQVVVLGGGLAGLSAGYELVKAGHAVTIIEKENAVGGLARTIEKNGFRFDTGPHRWYTKNDMVNNWMLKLLGKEVIKVPRLTRIYFDNIFFEYPIKVKSTLAGMGLVRTVFAVTDYIIVWLLGKFHKTTPLSLEEGYIQKFGPTLYKMFFKRYSEKLWGRPNTEISADWIGQRTRGFDIFTILKDLFFKQNKIVSFVDEFSYPEKGIGRIAERLAESIKRGGGKILLKSEVATVNSQKNRITSIVIRGKSSSQKISGDEFVSSIPLSDLVTSLQPAATDEIMLVNRKLAYRDELQVALFVKKTKITPDTWIYVHSLEIPFVRMMEMDNWSQKLSPKGTTTLVFEIACNIGDQYWEMSDKDLITLVTDSFVHEFKVLKHTDVLSGMVHRMPKEYPVYHIGYKEDLEVLKEFLSKYANLQIVGRNGTFRYNNMDHSIEMGLYAAWNIIENERKFDIESVNIEREYLEEKRLNTKQFELAEDQQVEDSKQ